MFEFSGEFSEESKQYILKDSAQSACLITSIVSIFFGAIIIIIAVITGITILLLALVALLAVVVTATISPYIYRVQTIQNMQPNRVCIGENGFIEADWETRSMGKSISDIKKIIDVEGCYHIVFYFPKESDLIIQKNLITKGTLEDFEEMFKEKLVKKYK